MKNYLDKFSLDKKVVFVVGGLGLIGTEVSKAVASAGAKTVILDIDRKKGAQYVKNIQKASCDVHFEYLDITDLINVKRNIKKLVKKYKKIHGWVNTSYPRTKDWGTPIEKERAQSFRENMDIHLNSYMWSSRCVALLMEKLKIPGAIVNLGSIYGIQANDFTIYKGTKMVSPMAYSVIKGGIISGTRYLASWFGPKGIRVNVLCPGGVFDGQHKKFLKNYEGKVPLRRMARPDEIASATIFLLSDAASYVTGSSLVVDGGWTIV